MQTLLLVILIASNLILVGSVIFCLRSIRRSVKEIDADIFSMLHVTKCLLINCGLLDENGNYRNKNSHSANDDRNQPLP